MFRPRTLALALLALLAAAVPSPEAVPSAMADSAVPIKNFAYQPAIVQVAPGDTITWVNEEPAVPHDVVSGAYGQPDAGQMFRSPLLMPGHTFAFTSAQPGEYPYFCSLHPTMTGSIVVGD